MRRIGILGGMGPEATLLIMRKTLEAVDAGDDADHIPLIVDQNPQVPSRIAHLIEGTGPDPAPMLAQMADPYSAINEMLMREYLTALENSDESKLARNSVGNISPPSATGYFYQLMAIAGWTSLPALPFLDKPVLVMLGEDDPIVPLANGRLLAGAIPGARLEVFKDAGHLFLMTHPAKAIGLIREFLA